MARINLFTHPSAEGVGITWTTILGSSSVALSSAQAWIGTQSYAWTTGGNGHHEIITPTGTAAFPVTAERSYAASVYFRSTLASTTVLYVHWYNAAGTELSTSSVSGTSSTTAWQRLGNMFVAPTGAAFAAFQMRLTSTTAAQTVYLDGFLLEQASTVDSYFDGSTGGSVWNGTANASTSTYTDPALPRTNYCKNPSFEVDVTAWDLGGLTRVTSQSYVGSAAAQTNSALSTGLLSVAYGFSSNAKTSSSIAVVPGEVWTISFYAKNTSAASQSAGIRTLWMNSGGTWVSDTGNPTNTTVTNSGWTRVVATVTVPASIGWMGFAPVGSAAIYMDAVLIEKAGFAGSYFDGSTYAPLGQVNAWTGTANASTSTSSVGANAQMSSAVEYILLNAGVESNMPLTSDAVEPVLMNVGVESPMAVSADAVEPVLSNVLEKDLTYAGPGPGLAGVYTGTITASANPTVNFTGTLEAGDVLIAAVVTGTNAEAATDISGLGATWTRIHGASGYMFSFWMGTGATGTGTITATGAAATSGKVVRVHHLRGVEPFAFAQPSWGYNMRLGSNQLLLGYAYNSTAATTSLNQTTKKPGPGGGWMDQADLTFLTGGNTFNTTVLKPSTFIEAFVDGNSAGLMMVVGSPVPGATVTDRTLLYNGGFEAGSTGWTGSNGNFTVSSTSPMFGTKCGAITATGAAPAIVRFTGNSPGPYCIPGRTYTASAYVKSVNARNARVNLRWSSYAGTFSSATNGTTVSLSAGQWTRLTVTGVAPAGQWVAGMSAELTDGISGDVMYVDGVRIDEGGTANPFFDATVTTANRINIDYPGGYFSLQTTIPATPPTPTVVDCFIGASTTAANPTVVMTNTPARRDVLILTDGRGHSLTAAITAVDGCGATWTKIGNAESYQSFWLGVGAKFAGTITATGESSGSGRNIRVHQLRGVTPDIHFQQRFTSYPVVATPNQIVLASGYSQSSSVVPIGTASWPINGWVVDSETVYSASQRHNTATHITRYPTNLDADISAYGQILVVGSPMPGMSVTRRNLIANSSMETTSGGWLGSGIAIGNRSLALAAIGNGSYTANYSNSANGGLYKAYGGNGPMAPVLPGHTYTFSCWMRCNNARTAAIAPQWLGSGQGLSSTGTFTPISLPANTWTRVSWTGTAPAGMSYAGVLTRSEGLASGDTLYWDGFLAEESATVGDYFDGWTDPPAGKANFFTNLGDESMSVQVSPLPPVLETNFNVLESGVWTLRTGVPKVYMGGSWVSAATKYWDGSQWVDLITDA